MDQYLFITILLITFSISVILYIQISDRKAEKDLEIDSEKEGGIEGGEENDDDEKNISAPDFTLLD